MKIRGILNRVPFQYGRSALQYFCIDNDLQFYYIEHVDINYAPLVATFVNKCQEIINLYTSNNTNRFLYKLKMQR